MNVIIKYIFMTQNTLSTYVPSDILNKCPKHKCIVCYIVLFICTRYI